MVCARCGCEFFHYEIEDTLVIKKCDKCDGIVFKEVSDEKEN